MMSCVQTMRFLAAFLTLILASGEPLPSERIINGINAQNGRYPYSVSLQRGNYHICGGSLIGKCGVW
jgi:secreted trypsin-like serine protease